MIKLAKTLIFTVSFYTLQAAPVMAQDEIVQTRAGSEIRVETMADGLNHPWGMAVLPDRRLLITERNTGNLLILNQDNTLSAPLDGVPEVWASGQGGLMDVALDPDFAENNYVYLTYAKPGEGGKATTALGRGRLSGNRIQDFEVLFVQKPMIEGPNHFGNRIVFSPDGQYLYLALGERFQFDPAQDLSNHLGTIVRLYPDGSVPEDNPFVGVENAENEIWSYGHRNIEAMAFQPQTGALWIAEMGPMGGDELNKIEKGANYGWPVVSWGDNYDGSQIPDPPTHPEFADAALQWTPVISPSGMVFYEGAMFPDWQSSAFIGGLSSQAVIRVAFDGAEAQEADRIPMSARIRDVAIAADGALYALTDEDNGKVLRLSAME